MEEIKVNLGERSYPIYIGFGILDDAGSLLEAADVCVLTNPVVESLYFGRLEAAIKDAGIEVTRIIVPDGEESKNFDVLCKVYDSLVTAGAARSTPLLTLGGGVIGDLGGFAAGSFMRGIPYVQIPTTLLSQVDSSVGGKTAVNHPSGKNLIGLFYQPKFVLIDINTLKTLPEEEFLSGLAEVIKYGIISDRELFDYLESKRDRILNKDGEAIKYIIKSSLKIKADIVSRDEREAGLRAVLNFGHTFGHAVENLTGYGVVKHGMAVAKGMAVSIEISRKMGLLSGSEQDRMLNLLEDYGFDLSLPKFSKGEYESVINYDKKASGEAINFVLTEGIGCVSLKMERVSDIVDIIEF
ncbi:MAG: 3-dehydroquinate synthase [Deltaproteobacteria bacterium]|uniref:3-dehydroquinate synthase n=1 Tax=Candidatus Zymogenus saltonus TaxID=2844893 RepID=A0A9D8PQ39_9DELT|nr:3-dehydroquinate synthase [Candidatus Zymogenus saltonus]